jgi:hypothetical protein
LSLPDRQSGWRVGRWNCGFGGQLLESGRGAV